MDLFIFQGKRKCNIIIRARSRVLKILRVRHGGALIEQFGVRVTQELHFVAGQRHSSPQPAGIIARDINARPFTDA